MPATTIHTPPKRPIAVSSLKWQPLDIAVGATLGAACGVIFWGFNFAYMPISSVFGAILPGFASIVHAVWYFSGTLAVLILRKPGAALYVNLIGTLVETVIGSQFDLGFVIISALLQGVFAEIPFALTRYRMFNLPISIASGALVGHAANNPPFNTPCFSIASIAYCEQVGVYIQVALPLRADRYF